MNDDPSDLEVLRVMADGGREICYRAMSQWTSGKYDCTGLSEAENHEIQQQAHRRWDKIKSRISDLATMWRKQIREDARAKDDAESDQSQAV